MSNKIQQGINGMNNELDVKKDQLIDLLIKMESVVVAYSGGVDSTLLAHLAAQSIGKQAIAVTAVSASLPKDELEEAQQIAVQFGFQHILIDSHEIDNPQYLENTPLRCYWCKHSVYGLLLEYAKQNNFKYVIDGTNFDDRGDHRPGRKAAREYGIKSPLLELEFSKEDIRSLAHHLGLPNWDKPAMACLSSRVPYGSRISLQVLEQIALAEQTLKMLGIRGSRVRHHGEIARIEVQPKDFERIIVNREKISNELQKIGFQYVTLDIMGYKMGSLNRAENQ